MQWRKKLSDLSSIVRKALKAFGNNFKYVETVEKVTNDTGTKFQADIKWMFDDFIPICKRGEMIYRLKQKRKIMPSLRLSGLKKIS